MVREGETRLVTRCSHLFGLLYNAFPLLFVLSDVFQHHSTEFGWTEARPFVEERQHDELHEAYTTQIEEYPLQELQKKISRVLSEELKEH